MTALNLPSWAVEKAETGDRFRVLEARKRGTLQIRWQERPRKLAARLGWPWLGLFGAEDAFVALMFAGDEAFGQALSSGGIEIFLPRQQHSLKEAELKNLDESYEDQRFWRSLVEGLREIRRAVEAGVVVQVGDESLTSFKTFYTWAHRRYYRLEDDVNTGWIGSD